MCKTVKVASRKRARGAPAHHHQRQPARKRGKRRPKSSSRSPHNGQRGPACIGGGHAALACAPAGVPVLLQEGCDKVYYKSSSGCRAKCCMVPACTPEGEDSPKWKATLAQRREDESPIAQPIGGDPRWEACNPSPPCSRLGARSCPASLPAQSPAPTDRGDVVYHHRLNYRRPGVPGESSDNAFCLGTPKRQKSGD